MVPGLHLVNMPRSRIWSQWLPSWNDNLYRWTRKLQGWIKWFETNPISGMLHIETPICPLKHIRLYRLSLTSKFNPVINAHFSYKHATKKTLPFFVQQILLRHMKYIWTKITQQESEKAVELRLRELSCSCSDLNLSLSLLICKTNGMSAMSVSNMSK